MDLCTNNCGEVYISPDLIKSAIYRNIKWTELIPFDAGSFGNMLEHWNSLIKCSGPRAK